MNSKNPQSEDIVTVHSDILKSASPQAQRIIDENPMWFSHFYFVAINDRDSDDDEIINQFWRSLKSPLIMEDKPRWFVPYSVLVELVDISRKNHSLQKKKR